MFHVQNHKRFLIQYELDFETTGNIFSVVFHSFNTFKQCWKIFIHLVCLSVPPSVLSLTLINVLQTSWNLYVLFIFGIEWIVLKMICIWLRFRQQRHINVFRCIWANGEKFLKCFLAYLYYTKYNEINIFHSDVQ